MYSIQETVLATEERSLYHALSLVVAQRALLLTKVKLSALLSPNVGQSQQTTHTYLDRYTVDFVLCDRSTTRPLVIVLCDKVHGSNCALNSTNDVIERLATNAGLPLLRLEQAASYRMDKLLRLLEPYLTVDNRGTDYTNGDRLVAPTNCGVPTLARPAMRFSTN